MDGVEQTRGIDMHGTEGQGRDPHRTVIHIARNAFVCKAEHLCARQTKTGQAQHRAHPASADNDGPDDGPREGTLKHRSSAQIKRYVPIRTPAPSTKLYKAMMPALMKNAGIPLFQSTHVCHQSRTRMTNKAERPPNAPPCSETPSQSELGV